MEKRRIAKQKEEQRRLKEQEEQKLKEHEKLETPSQPEEEKKE